MKRFYFWILVLVIISSNLFGLKVGLDSGHSIKELYKSGGAFDVIIAYDRNGNPITSSYYSVAWPAGGAQITGVKVPKLV